jgi:hypothetical protein
MGLFLFLLKSQSAIPADSGCPDARAPGSRDRRQDHRHHETFRADLRRSRAQICIARCYHNARRETFPAPAILAGAAYSEEVLKVIISGRRRAKLNGVVAANPGTSAVELDITDPAPPQQG